ncbi:hypothetical protein REPUB_Repub05bG0030700 [Reevesia pubescens]
MENIRKKSKTRKKSSNPLGTYHRLLSSTDKENFWDISLPLDDSPDHQSIPNSTVWASSFGWLLISQEEEHSESCNSYQFSVWNPESTKVIKLPLLNLKPNQKIRAGTLLSPPGNPDIYRQDARNFISDGCIAHCNGKLYASTVRKGRIMLIEESTSKNLKLRPLKNCRLPRSFSPSNCGSRYLLDFCGQLCAIEVAWGGVDYQDIINFEASKLELSGKRMKWVKVESAKDQAFFLSDNYAFSCPVNESEIEGGCIYFSQNKRLYSFNIEDKRISVSLPLENLLESENPPLLAMRDFRFGNPQAKPENTIISTLEAEKDEKIVIEDNSEGQGRNICELPFDVLELIAKNLYLVDYINFRFVCNTFRLVAPHIKWREASFKSQSQSLSPWLVFPKGKLCSIHNFLDPQRGGKYLSKSPEDLLDAVIRYSKDGWLLMCNPNFMSFYYPFKRKVIKLPQVSRGGECCFGYDLSSSPTSLNSILVGSNSCAIYYFCWQEGEWIEYMPPDYFDFEVNQNSPIYYDGAFYFLSRDGKLGVFALKDGQVSCKILRELESPCDSYCYNYLLECNGNLVSVFVDDQMVHVYKLKFTTVMAWEKITKFRKSCIVYKFYTCGNKEVVADFNNTTEFLFSSWIEPRFALPVINIQVLFVSLFFQQAITSCLIVVLRPNGQSLKEHHALLGLFLSVRN